MNHVNQTDSGMNSLAINNRYRLASLVLMISFAAVATDGVRAQDKSVNPGINKSFDNPDVEQFIGRFETEGRDAFDHRNEIVKAIGLRPGLAIADVGAGTGLFTRLFSPIVGKTGRVYAVDISERFVKHVEDSARKSGLTNVVGVVCKPDSVNLPENSVDVVFICDTYHHFEFPAKTMTSIRRSLRPGGEVILIDFERIKGVSREWIFGHVRAGQEVFTQEIIDAGFRQLESRDDLLDESYFVRFTKVAREEIETDLLPLPRTVPSPADNPTTPEKVELGRKLFFDERLSGSNDMSCATCHDPARAYGDGLALSPGAGGVKLERHSQSCLNVGLLPNLFWDGRAADLEQQSLQPIESEQEMAQDLTELEKELRQSKEYVAAFQTVFGTLPSRDGIAKALAAFQRTLVTGPSPFDRYLAGDKSALSADARRGLELFRGEAGCIVCHHGPSLTDGKFYRLGVEFKDVGRMGITGKSEDRYRFRTPGLRNIAQTGPYMHDGSIATLEDVVLFYFRGIPDKSPEGLTPDTAALTGQSISDVAPLVAFLESLSGEIPMHGSSSKSAEKTSEEPQPPKLSSEPNRIKLWPGMKPEPPSAITVHLPDEGNGAAVIICPGGGYGGLVTGAEGHGIAKWLNGHGIAGIVLEYELPKGRHSVPLRDAQRAIRIARSNSEAWHLDPERIGIAGFSAGGHLASTAGTHFDAGDKAAEDPVERQSSRPDFMILVYPVVSMGEHTHGGSKLNLLGKNPSPELVRLYSNELQVTKETPPTYIAHAIDDKPVPIENSRQLATALKKAGVPTQLLELPTGGHGLNGYKGPMWDAWQSGVLEWIEELNVVTNPTK